MSIVTAGQTLKVRSTFTKGGADPSAPCPGILTYVWPTNADTGAGQVRANVIAYLDGRSPMPLLNLRVYEYEGDGGADDADFNGFAFVNDGSAPSEVVGPNIKRAHK